MNKVIVSIILIILLTAIQVGFISSLAVPLSRLNLILCWLAFVVLVFDFNIAIWQAMGFGILLEMFSVYPYSLILLSLLLTIMALRFLFTHLFTNRSYYSLVSLGVIAIAVYNFLILGGGWLLYILKISAISQELSWQYLESILWQVVFNLICLTVIWILFNNISRRLKLSYILEK